MRMNKKSQSAGRHTDLGLKAQATVTKSMAESLLAAFAERTEEEVLILEVRDFGLWVVDPVSGRRLFVGSSTPVGTKC